jgi:hypothetical protein
MPARLFSRPILRGFTSQSAGAAPLPALHYYTHSKRGDNADDWGVDSKQERMVKARHKRRLVVIIEGMPTSS